MAKTLKGIQDCLNNLKESLRQEVSNLKLLSGENLAEFKNIFSIDEDIELYFNAFNIVIIDKITHDEMQSYLNEKNRILSFDCPEYNTHVWVYKYFNDRVLKDYLK